MVKSKHVQCFVGWSCCQYLNTIYSVTQRRCELIPCSQRAHLNISTWRITVRSQIANTVSSQETNSQWARRFHCMVRSTGWSHKELTASLPWELQTNQKLTASSQCELILWSHCELNECPQNESTVNFSFQREPWMAKETQKRAKVLLKISMAKQKKTPHHQFIAWLVRWIWSQDRTAVHENWGLDSNHRTMKHMCSQIPWKRIDLTEAKNVMTYIKTNGCRMY